MQNLPLLNRNPLILLTLQAGVNSNPEINTVVNGQRTSATNITLDGINIQDNFIRSNATDFNPIRLTQTSAAEFTVINQNANASAGQGSSQVAFTTPSGGNDWHGDVYWFHRNNKLSANEWFNNASTPRTEIEKLIQNQGGFSIGGPVVKDKLFVWGNYELFRRAGSATQNTTILTSTARQGIFIYDTQNDIDTGATPLPGTVTCASGLAIIPAGTLCQMDLMATMGTTIDPFISGLLARTPTTGNNTSLGDGLNTTGFRFNQSDGTERDQYTARVDWNPSASHSVSGTWKRQDATTDRPDIDNTFNATPVVSNITARDFLSTSWRWSPSGRFTNEVRYGYVLSEVPFNTSEDFTMPGAPLGVGVVTSLEWTNPIEDFRFQGRNTDTYSFQDNATYIRGNHNFNFGFQTQMIRVKSFTGFDVIPSYDIGTSVASGLSVSSSFFPGGISGGDRGRAEDLHESLAGLIDTVDQEFNVTSQTSGFVPEALETRNFELDTWSLYFSDSWRVMPRLSLTFGLRWEYLAPLKEANGLFLRAVLPAETTAAAVAALGDANAAIDFAPQPLFQPDYKQFAPQFGFAWDMFGDGKTSLRGGFSMHYINDEGIRAGDNAASATAGLNTTASLNQTAFSLSGGNLPALGPVATPTFVVPRTQFDNYVDNGFAPATAFLVDPQLRTPYVLTWNLGFEREIGWKTAVDVRYIGTRGVKLQRALDFNQVVISNLLPDFQILQQNGFNFQALTGSFDATCGGVVTVDTSVPGCVATSGAWDQFPNFGFLFVGFVGDFVRTGEIGELISVLHFNDLCGSVVCAPNSLASVADMLTNLSTSDYHAGSIEVRRSFSDGLFFQGNYTFSKVLSDFGGEGQANFEPFLDVAQPDRDRRRADYDITHAFKANFNYELPMGSGHAFSPQNGFLNKLVSGWGITSIFTWQTGTPISLRTTRGTLNRSGRCRDRCSPDSTLTASQVEALFGIQTNPANGDIIFVNPAMINTNNSNTGVNDETLVCVPFGPAGLCNPRSGALGNLPLNFIDTPSFFDWNFSILKKTNITEGTSMEFRAEFFNFLNHPTFDVDTAEMNINSTSFGKPNNTLGSSRIIQLALRFIF